MTRLLEWEERYNPWSESAEQMRELILMADTQEVTSYLEDVNRRLQEGSDKDLAKYVLDVAAPVANRLNYQRLKHDLEDTAFARVYPEQYTMVIKLLRRYRADRDRDVLRAKHALDIALGKAGLEDVTIEARTKRPYSLYKKLSKSGTITDVHDLLALRIITEAEADCYTVLDIIHDTYSPLLERFKDYIKRPKPNGYQSLHTTVSRGKQRIEIQIRTRQMHEQAEYGGAAHWWYDEHKDSKHYGRGETVAKRPDNDTGARVFAFSPKGDVYMLPAGATALDFAFAVHTQVGLRTYRARVNNRLVKLDTLLASGDMVAIDTSKTPRPRRDWLRMVSSPKARHRIQSWLKQLEYDRHLELGREQLLEVFQGQLPKDLERIAADYNLRSGDDLLVAVGTGDIKPDAVYRHVYPPRPPQPKAASTTGDYTTRPLNIAGMSGLQYRLARCCGPKPHGMIIGFITRDLGITIHRSDCAQILDVDSDRLLDAYWE